MVMCLPFKELGGRGQRVSHTEKQKNRGYSFLEKELRCIDQGNVIEFEFEGHPKVKL
jgi:hypothetical protein